MSRHLITGDIGSSVQAYDADLTRIAVSGPSDVGKYLNGGATAGYTKPAGLQHPAFITGDAYEIASFYGGTRILKTAGPVLTANRVYLFPFICRQTITITKLGFNVTTAVAASNARMGFYADSAGVPSGAALVDTGDIATATTGAKASGTISIALAVDTPYWWAVHPSAAIALNGYNGGPVPMIGASAMGSAATNNCYIMTSTYGALPTISGITRTSVSAPPVLEFLL